MSVCLCKLISGGKIPFDAVSRRGQLIDDQCLKRRNRHATTIAMIAMGRALNMRCGSTLTRIAVLVLCDGHRYRPRHEHRYTDCNRAFEKPRAISESTLLDEFTNRLTVQHRTTWTCEMRIHFTERSIHALNSGRVAKFIEPKSPSP
jgi:hypothetical protein